MPLSEADTRAKLIDPAPHGAARPDRAFDSERGEGSPLGAQFARGMVLVKVRGQKIMDRLMFSAALALGKCGKSNLQNFTNFVDTQAGGWTLAYQVQKAIPDRHADKIILERVFFSQVDELENAHRIRGAFLLNFCNKRQTCYCPTNFSFACSTIFL